MERPCAEDCFEGKPLLGEVVLCSNENLSPVVRKVDNAIQCIEQFVSLIFILWIEIYPVYSTIQRLNNGCGLLVLVGVGGFLGWYFTRGDESLGRPYKKQTVSSLLFFF